ncbi:MAG TPA: sulfotransferase [Steroidobacteraceae bacterium]
MPPFVIFALPRSRSTWLSRFLTYADWQCGHDELRHCRSLEDVQSWLAQPCTGTVETAAAPFWRLLACYRPDARVVTVRRPVEEVLPSLRQAGLQFDERTMRLVLGHLDHKLDQIECRMPDVLSVQFSALVEEQTCARVFEHCLPYQHDSAWWRALAGTNIQINLPFLMRYYGAHQKQLAKLAKQARHRMLAGMERGFELDGVTFQHEPFEQFYRDAQPLFAEHLVQTDQSPDDHTLKNLPILQALDAMGALQTMTARSNGRMFGYLMTVIGPSLDARDRLAGFHTIFFASPLIRGLGMKLQLAALDALRARGVHEVQMRAGHRGAGPRLGTFYRRLGAEEFGQLYRLSLD